MDFISSTAQRLVSGVELGASKPALRPAQVLDRQGGSAPKNANRPEGSATRSDFNQIDPSSSSPETAYTVFNPIAEPPKSEASAFDLQQKNFAYLPITTASLSKTGTFVIEQKSASPTDVFLQIANPPNDIRLIDTYV